MPLPLPRFRFHKNVVFSLLAIPPTNAEAAGPADRFRFRIPDAVTKPSLDFLFPMSSKASRRAERESEALSIAQAKYKRKMIE